jgi:hypothetical protein
VSKKGGVRIRGKSRKHLRKENEKMELKYLIFFGVLALGVPMGFILASRIRLVEDVVLFFAVFFTCSLLGAINFVSIETYRGTSKGFEISLVDVATLMLFLLAVSRRGKNGLSIFPPGSFLYFLYFSISWISVLNAAEGVYCYFELFKMAKMYFFYWTMYNYMASTRDVFRVVRIIPAIIVYIFLVVLDQKYRMCLFQTNGPLPHQNSLVMYMMIFNTILFAWVLNGGLSLAKAAGMLLVFGMGSVCVVSTLSRAGLMCYSLACGVIMALSLVNGFEFRKLAILALMLLGAFGVLAKSMDSIIERFTTAPEQSKLTRVALAEAAVNMANDKFFGVGLNNWGIKINPPYSYSDHIERKNEDFKEGIVETVYLLVAAETGWLNLLVFLLLIIRFYVVNIFNYFRYRRTELFFITVALAGGLGGVYLESTLEWVLKQTNNYYQLMLVFAFISVMSKFHRENSSVAHSSDVEAMESAPAVPSDAMTT